MANADTPFGLRPVRHRNGAPYNGAVTPYYIPSGYGTALYIGDPVVITGTANTSAVKVPGVGDFGPGTLQEINKATAAGGNYISGVIVGFAANVSDLSKQYNPASTERVALVADDPDLVFEIQEDGVGATLAATDMGLNADLVYTHSGSAYTGQSGAELDISTKNTTATLQLKILRLVNRSDVELGVNGKLEVAINLHTQRYTTGI